MNKLLIFLVIIGNFSASNAMESIDIEEDKNNHLIVLSLDNGSESLLSRPPTDIKVITNKLANFLNTETSNQGSVTLFASGNLVRNIFKEPLTYLIKSEKDFNNQWLVFHSKLRNFYIFITRNNFEVLATVFNIHELETVTFALLNKESVEAFDDKIDNKKVEINVDDLKEFFIRKNGKSRYSMPIIICGHSSFSTHSKEGHICALLLNQFSKLFDFFTNDSAILPSAVYYHSCFTGGEHFNLPFYENLDIKKPKTYPFIVATSTIGNYTVNSAQVQNIDINRLLKGFQVLLTQDDYDIKEIAAICQPFSLEKYLAVRWPFTTKFEVLDLIKSYYSSDDMTQEYMKDLSISPSEGKRMAHPNAIYFVNTLKVDEGKNLFANLFSNTFRLPDSANPSIDTTLFIRELNLIHGSQFSDGILKSFLGNIPEGIKRAETLPDGKTQIKLKHVFIFVKNFYKDQKKEFYYLSIPSMETFYEKEVSKNPRYGRSSLKTIKRFSSFKSDNLFILNDRILEKTSQLTFSEGVKHITTGLLTAIKKKDGFALNYSFYRPTSQCKALVPLLEEISAMENPGLEVLETLWQLIEANSDEY